MSENKETDQLSRSFIGAEPTVTQGPVPFQGFNIESSWYRPEPETQSVAATSSRESYQTAPELSEPTEKLFREIIRRNKTPQTKTNPIEINTMATDTRMKTPENPEEGPSTSINPKEPFIEPPPIPSPHQRPERNPVFFPEMPLPPTSKPVELKLASPKPFTGNREDLNGFLLDLNLYLTVNHEIYDNSFKKIGYALSFMTSGDAKSWKDQYLEESNRGEYLDLGTWAEFTQALRESFEPFDAPGDAMEEIIHLKKGDATVEDHVARYKILLRKAKIPEDSPPAIDYFLRSLPVPLQRDLLRLPTPPKELKEWYSWASKLDNNYKRMQRILGRSTGKTPEKNQEDDGISSVEIQTRWTSML